VFCDEAVKFKLTVLKLRLENRINSNYFEERGNNDDN